MVSWVQPAASWARSLGDAESVVRIRERDRQSLSCLDSGHTRDGPSGK